MSEIISGKEAKLLLAQCNYVEYLDTRSTFNKLGWGDANDLTGHQFSIEYYKFRLKPRTIKIGDVEVPAPFNPKVGDTVYLISDDHNRGYCSFKWKDFHSANFGAWKNEEEIKQVVTALRQVFKGK